MKNRTPAPANGGQPLPDFQPVDRRYRHDGWTPTRQRAFIAALADTGSVSRACAMVNMASEGAYMLRRQAGAESFRRAWEAALDFGVQRLRDIAMERALTGELVPVMSFGKLVGYRRVTNDRLLMFILRMHGPQRIPLPRAEEGANRQRRRKGEGLSKLAAPLAPTPAERADDQANLIRHFDPVALSLDQIEALQAVLAEAAAAHRDRLEHPEHDPAIHYLPAREVNETLETGFSEDETGAYEKGGPDEIDWRRLDPEGLRQQAELDQILADLRANPRTPEEIAAGRARIEAERARSTADEGAKTRRGLRDDSQ
ncbi:hypothetical protein GCM10022281_07330 [Sphingomonas rosea]|uniref:Terminase small subunit n=1 Tax=Sphingomonas rosea TaxID=335605 RepID=A0ABP7TS67_9SPHN